MRVAERRTNLCERQTERWRPPLQTASKSSVHRILGTMRRFLDLQTASIWADLAADLPGVRGTVLDVGCGAQPFRELFDPGVRYIGLDTINAKAHFGYEAPDTTYFQGNTWPVADASIDFILCTETLEHVKATDYFLAEAY